MGMWRNCKICGQGVYLVQESSGRWTAYADDYSDRQHICQRRAAENDVHIGNIFEIGSCTRRIVYKALGTFGDYDFSFKAWEAFYVGRAEESFIKDILYRKGIKFVTKQKDVSFHGFTGRIDGLVLINNKLNLLECKTIPDAAKFKTFVGSSIARDHPSYYAQIQAYMSATRTQQCLLIVLGDDMDSWHEMQIPIDRDTITALQQKAQRVKECVNKGELPSGDPYVAPFLECDYCPYEAPCKRP